MESEIREISRKMNDVLTRAACDFEDDTRHRQDVAKDIENEVAITDCCRRVPAVIGHLLRTFNLALAPLTRRAFVAEFLAIRFEASTARHHCHNHATSREVTKTPALIARGFTLQ